MDDKQFEETLKYFDQKHKECLIQKISYDTWLRLITPLRWGAVILGVILPAFVGVSFFIDSGLISKEHWKIICSLVLLVSSIVSGLHTALKCDTHQQECLKLSKQYEALANKFEFAKTYNRNQVEAEAKTLSDKFGDLVGNSTTTPAQWCIDRAAKKVNSRLRKG